MNILYKFKWFPISFRIITLITFVLLIIIGFTAPTNDPFFISQLSKTNLTTSFIWRLWWPLIVLSSIILGRVWCVICPVEMITSFFAKYGFQLKRPKFILSGWVITLFYLLILVIGISMLEIDLNPVFTSLYLLSIVLIAILSGVIFEKNTYCRYICPIGYLLGIFSKMAFLGWRVKNKHVCQTCRDKSCIKKKYTYQLNYKSCGIDLIPAAINSNSDCLFCGGCLKTCYTYETENNPLRPNPGIVKIGFAKDLLQLQPVRLVEWIFLFLLTGSAIFEMTHFNITTIFGDSIFNLEHSTFQRHDGLMKTMGSIAFLYIILPSVIWFSPYITIKLYKLKISLSYYIRNISLAYIPVITAFFIGLAIMEMTTKIPYYKYIVNDVRGVETVKSILFGQINQPGLPPWTDWFFSIFLLALLTGGIFISHKVLKKLILKINTQKDRKVIFILPTMFITIMYLSAVFYMFY